MEVGRDPALGLVAGRGARGRLRAGSAVLAVTLLASGIPTSPEEAFGGSSAVCVRATHLVRKITRCKTRRARCSAREPLTDAVRLFKSTF